MASGSGRYVTVFGRHGLAGFIQKPLLIGPNVSNRNIETVNSTLQCVHKSRQPFLEGLALASFFCSHPVGQLRDDDCARIAAVLFLFESLPMPDEPEGAIGFQRRMSLKEGGVDAVD